MNEVKQKSIEEESIALEQSMESSSESKKGVLVWIKEHKAQLILAGVSITAIVGIIWGVKNKDELTKLWSSFAKSIKMDSVTTTTSMPKIATATPATEAILRKRPYTSPTEAFDVRRHIRTMAAGKHHSAEKAAEAAKLGIDLLPNQTLVDPYTKCAA